MATTKKLILSGFLALSLLLSACASTSSPSYKDDPLEPLNRGIYTFNDIIDTVIIRPLAMVYKTVVPVIMQDIIANFIDNITTPVSAINYALQGNADMAGVAVGRFMTNTVFGLLGTLDVASALDIPETKTDFGLTLAKWGVTESPYFVIPLLGPSTIRDGIGKGVDFFLQPINILALNPNNQNINDLDWVRFGAEVLDTRARALAITDDIKLNSVDPYAAMRSMYLQNRRYSISANMKVIDRGRPVKENYDFDFSADY